MHPAPGQHCLGCNFYGKVEKAIPQLPLSFVTTQKGIIWVCLHLWDGGKLIAGVLVVERTPQTPHLNY